jgi:hypothetical protein
VPADSTVSSNNSTLDTDYHYLILAKILGILWVVDAVLQVQPKMFSDEFISGVLQPTLQNQPAFLTSLINFGITLFSANIFLANLGAFFIQLLIGLMIFFPSRQKIFKVGLVLSILWGLAIWVFGEGLGGLFTGMSSFYTGAPGSVVIYIIAALFLLFPTYFAVKNLSKVIGSLFIVGALLQLQPNFWTADGVKSIFNLAASDTDSLISQPASALASLVSQSPIVANAILALLLLNVGLLLLFYANRLVVSVAIVFLLIVWWLGQDFGGILTFYSGTSTDPNTAPVLALLLALFLFGYNFKKENTTPEIAPPLPPPVPNPQPVPVPQPIPPPTPEVIPPAPPLPQNQAPIQ